MLRVVLDPNVLISALISSAGAPRLLLRRWIAGTFEVLVSERLLGELTDTLLRPKIRRYSTPEEAMSFVVLLRLVGTMRPDPPLEAGLTPDPEDDYLVSLARSAQATCIVSGDAHLTDLPNPEPPVFTPRQFLEVLEVEG